MQLSTLELEQELENYLLENPLLEREEEEYATQQSATSKNESDGAETEAVATPSSNDSWLGEESGYSSSASSFDDDDNDHQDIRAATTSLREHLSWQLGLMSILERDRTLVQCLIEALDDDGYQSLEKFLPKRFPQS